MAYDLQLAARTRDHLSQFWGLQIEEKKMFRGLAFMINGKLCVCVSDNNLMCRFDPAEQEMVAEKIGVEPMIMRGKHLQGYCYVTPTGLSSKKELAYWIDLCLAFNEKAKASKKREKMR
ncbi:TfoX/Sxy family protein [Flavisolibacter sp. BT320]|nr:TfoX/Sxy family protein [Flavisolibacter longurius]